MMEGDHRPAARAETLRAWRPARETQAKRRNRENEEDKEVAGSDSTLALEISLCYALLDFLQELKR